MISKTFQMIAETGNNGNVPTSSGCQVAEAGRPVRRLRRKRRLPLDSEDEEENAYEDEVNEAACTSFKDSCEKQGQLSQSSLCSANWAEGACSVPWVWSWFTSVMGISVLRSHRGEWIAQVKRKSGVHSNNTTSVVIMWITTFKYCCVILKISVKPQGLFGFYCILACTLTALPETCISGA